MPDPSLPTLHCIGHGHIDPTWLWRWTEGVEEVRATFRSALDRMDEHPGVCFTASSAQFYAWMREIDPAAFARIARRVREGRWEAAGGFWIEPDCNLPAGESFVRQGLYGQRFFREHFGEYCRIGFHPDSFGHAHTLPTILHGLGMRYYVYMRPMPDIERGYPHGTLFRWEGPDGSRLLAACLLESYNADAAELRERIPRLARSPHHAPGQQHVLCFFGIGNHGGGPTRETIALIDASMRDPALPSMQYGTLRGFFDAIERDGCAQPGIERSEIQHHARGCYSANARMKRWMRRAEHAIITAERWAAIAWFEDGAAYPKTDLDAAWERVLYNQFHDILAGSSIASSYEDTRDQLGAACDAAARIVNRVVQSIARDIDTTPGGNTAVVFNPHPWPLRAPVLVSPIATRTLAPEVHVVDGAGAAVASQLVIGERVGDGQRVAFTADLPALGYRCYHVRSGASSASSDAPDAGPLHLENRWWRMEFDPQQGHIARLYDRINGVEVLRSGAWLAAVDDPSDTWSHGVRAYRGERGRFGTAQMRVAECGPALATHRAAVELGASHVRIDTTLYADSPAIDLVLHLDWRAAYTLLKAGFEPAFAADTLTCEAPYGHVARAATGDEEPMQRWADWSGAAYGLTIVNDGQYAMDAGGGVLRITLLRSPAYAHHDPWKYDPADGHRIMDQGEHDVRLRLLPHAGPLEPAAAARAAWAFNAPPLAHVESAHPGRRPASASLAACGAPHCIATVLKKSEDGGDLVVRLHETAGRPGEAVLELGGGRTCRLDVPPLGIATYRIPRGAGAPQRTDLLEEPCE